MIELKNLTKRYGSVLAVNNINLSIPKGEIFGFIGPNGAGKTTTIRMMGGVLAPTEGSVIIEGINMADDPESVKRRIGFIPDRPFLYEKLTAMEFLRFSADLYGVEDGVFMVKARSLLEKFSLYEWAYDLIESYSHGMKQRLIFSAALLHDPTVIVVDEPMVGLDPAGIKMVKDMFRELAANGTTIFMSTHTLTVAEDICDRIGIIHKGSVIAIGTAGDLKRSAGVEEADLEKVFL
ncbi:MAG: ABC transporter ATP-binding protein, partial [Deltaproteobacteria bacterium]|nr:ABC transporter ATP-binding protein [Deltaproteobacteria bacterium]